MPELPEVEHARARLLLHFDHEAIRDARALDRRVIAQQSLAAFREALVGRRIEGAERFGKHVIVRLSGRYGLWFHLGMTGRVALSGDRDEAIEAATGLPRFTRWWIEAERGRRAYFVDPRRLGRARAGPLDRVRRIAGIDRLGPDALEVRTGTRLREAIGEARSAVAAALMDQSRLAGLGNIQATEALWLAAIHPETPVRALGPNDFDRLAAAIAQSLRRTAATMSPKRALVYVAAGGPNPFWVYGREGAPCPRCGARIVREPWRGRPSYRCPRCQRAQRRRA